MHLSFSSTEQHDIRVAMVVCANRCLPVASFYSGTVALEALGLYIRSTPNLGVCCARHGNDFHTCSREEQKGYGYSILCSCRVQLLITQQFVVSKDVLHPSHRQSQKSINKMKRFKLQASTELTSEGLPNKMIDLELDLECPRRPKLPQIGSGNPRTRCG